MLFSLLPCVPVAVHAPMHARARPCTVRARAPFVHSDEINLTPATLLPARPHHLLDGRPLRAFDRARARALGLCTSVHASVHARASSSSCPDNGITPLVDRLGSQLDAAFSDIVGAL
jgi:hypothetical protein